MTTTGHQSLSSRTKFADFCKICDKIESKRSKNDKKVVLKKFIDWWKREAIDAVDDSFYSALRLLCPHKDNKTFSPPTADADTTYASQQSGGQYSGRAAYGMKVDKLRHKYIKILGLSKESEDAKKLINFYKDANNRHKDLGSVLYEVMANRARVADGRITLDELNSDLDAIGRAYEDNRVSDAEDVLTKLINNMTPLENKWLVRIVLKDMLLGMGDTAILNTYHPDAQEYYNTIHNLRTVCVDLSDPSVPLSVKSIQLFHPFSPMLSERVKLNTINRIIDSNKFFVEIKYDGQRFQIHKRHNQYKYFSRNCVDFSDAFNESLTPFIAEAFGDSVVDVILDGEMMAYETSTNRLLTQTEPGFDVKRIAAKDTDRHSLFVVFDILYLNGEVLTTRPLVERVKILEKTIKPIDTRLRLTDRRLCETKDDIIEAMNMAIDRHEEGIIVKLCDSVYKVNKRQGGGWIKLKPDYIDGLMDELDLLIIGGLYGSRGGISHFFVGLKVPESEGSPPQRFVSVSRVGTGYSDEELRRLQNKLKDHWRPFDKKKCPQFLSFGRLKPEVWIEPKNSVILQIKAAEIMESSGDYGTHYTLRFPRVMKIRDDKEWHECMSLVEMDQLKSTGLLVNATVNYKSEEPEEKRRRVMDRPTVSLNNQLTDVSEVNIKSDIFADKEFCLVPFRDLTIKQSLECVIREFGGKVVANPAPNKTYCIIADNCDTIAVKRHVNSGKYNVIKSSWIDKCVTERQLLDWTPSDVWSQTVESKEKMSHKFDKYGDSYTQLITELELKELFDRMNANDVDQSLLSNKQIADIEFELWPNERPMSFFRTISVFVDTEDSIDGLSNKYWQSIVRFYGATVVQSLTDNPSHVLILKPNRSDHFKQINRQNSQKFHIVGHKWIEKCIQMKDLLDFVDF